MGSKFGTDRQTNSYHQIRGYADFFFQLNLLPHYSLLSQGNFFLIIILESHFEVTYQYNVSIGIFVSVNVFASF